MRIKAKPWWNRKTKSCLAAKLYHSYRRESQNESVLTFDDQGEVSIPEGCWGDAHPAQVVGVVDPLVSCREHVHHPLHGVVRVGPEQVPVDHPLSVPHPVPGPHHAAAHTLQHHPRPSRGAHVVASHHHTATAVRLTQHWGTERGCRVFTLRCHAFTKSLRRNA